MTGEVELGSPWSVLIPDLGLIAAGSTPEPKVGDFHPFATTGHFTFDGSGNFSGAHDTDFAGGFLHFAHDAGTYNVNSDCTTGSISILNEGVTLSIVITSAGQEVKLTSATAGRVFSGTLRLAATSCSAATLSGNSYGYATHGLELNSVVEVGFRPASHESAVSCPSLTLVRFHLMPTEAFRGWIT